MTNIYKQNNKQQMTTSNLPTPQNISKWSLARKECISKNKYLMNQIDLKNTIIKNLNDEIKKIKLKLTLGNFDFPRDISESKKIYFDFRLKENDGEYITYYVTNDELGYDNEVEIPISEIIQHFEDSNVSQNDIEEFITDYLLSSISY